MTLVTAVVTTTGRESLARACAGVLSQTVPAELVIVVDSSDAWVHSAVTTAYPSAEVLPSAARNGSASRNIGMRAARGRYIAFLDDDDWWEPTWLETAVETARRVDGAGSAPVIVTGAASFHRTSGRVQVLPARPMPREPRLVLDELVRRRYVASASAFVQTSAMVVNRPVAEAVAWPEELPRHQDWEFFRQVTRRTASEWRHVDTPLVHVAQGSAQSVSATAARPARHGRGGGRPGRPAGARGVVARTGPARPGPGAGRRVRAIRNWAAACEALAC